MMQQPTALCTNNSIILMIPTQPNYNTSTTDVQWIYNLIAIASQ